MRGRGTASTAAPATSTQVASAPPVAPNPGTIVPTASGAPTTTASGTVAPTSTAPVIDQSQVDQEVAKRLAAERARLDQQQRAQAAAAAAAAARPTPAPITPAPQPVIPPPAPAPVAAPVPAPVEPAPQPVAPAPAPAPAPQPARVREGDLVPAGTEGLVAARMTGRANVPYPPIAKAQKVQGTVIINVLISESGQVLDLRVLRGINLLNDAAEQIIRRSRFSPPTKDGVRVKAWTTVPVDFKL